MLILNRQAEAAINKKVDGMIPKFQLDVAI